ncbi:uncharacterized protein PITG_19654 [Phytophthora infestans T30-4]|uniref:Uncharacterized protein n=1 Tax=Phytophthora infestans (strain T30-4) TaxID=403677 RepID=D0P0I3_PHYIT|nr:uncharacterized protein PITG_19654 [Phytophthora infestans T30-4]EEY52945.1 conserved hypothetical protein [Phytophthora infestans T30-4]|eukprot:XP_002896212.1 conserved hypothetical protein [Phytophthora infestans T30-4]
MIEELLHFRFSDGDVKRHLETADTKTKKTLAWQLFASVLSDSLGMVLNHEQVGLNSHAKEKREMQKTGNNPRATEMDEGLWAILNDTFGGCVGISGEMLLDSTVPEEDNEDADSSSAKDDTTS